MSLSNPIKSNCRLYQNVTLKPVLETLHCQQTVLMFVEPMTAYGYIRKLKLKKRIKLVA